jgi:hypothetical protein
MPKKPFQIKDQQKQLRFSLHRNNWTNNFRILPRCITLYFTSYYLEGQLAISFQLTHAVTIKCNKYTVAPPPHTLTLLPQEQARTGQHIAPRKTSIPYHLTFFGTDPKNHIVFRGDDTEGTTQRGRHRGDDTEGKTQRGRHRGEDTEGKTQRGRHQEEDTGRGETERRDVEISNRDMGRIL